jgi:hypothetical protein
VRALLLLALVACSSAKKQQPPPAAGPLIDTMKVFADRACACETDKDCLHGVRDEYDAQKDQLLGNGARLSGDDKAKFDAEHGRLQGCGDAGGLTFWDH